MAKKRTQGSAVRARQRQAVAARRVGIGSKCACGETRPLALIRDGDSVICAECQRKQHGKTPDDDHHVGGRNNHPATVEVPANDHRAILSAKQYDWPKEVRENPDGSPFLAAAACIRGAADTIVYVVESVVLWIAHMLEMAHDYLTERLGPQWWVNTPIEPFSRERKPHV